MREIIAIVRMNKVQATKEAVAALGFPSITLRKVLGRGRQRGLYGEYTHPVPEPDGEMEGLRFIPKRELTLLVDDREVPRIVKAIIDVNCTGQAGDGKIFVCPVSEVVRVRTAEHGIPALT